MKNHVFWWKITFFEVLTLFLRLVRAIIVYFSAKGPLLSLDSVKRVPFQPKLPQKSPPEPYLRAISTTGMLIQGGGKAICMLRRSFGRAISIEKVPKWPKSQSETGPPSGLKGFSSFPLGFTWENWVPKRGFSTSQLFGGPPLSLGPPPLV